jgi:hypothetical protein
MIKGQQRQTDKVISKDSAMGILEAQSNLTYLYTSVLDEIVDKMTELDKRGSVQ